MNDATCPTTAYWRVLQAELSWPFEDNARRRHHPDIVTQRLNAVATEPTIEFHAFCRDHAIPACARDALALLVLVASSLSARARTNPSSPYAPTCRLAQIVAWAGETREERATIRRTLAGLAGLGLFALDAQDTIVATPRLVELVTGEPWSVQIPNTCMLAVEADAHRGVIEDDTLASLVALVTATRARAPALHVMGPRGSGRLRVLAAIAARTDRASLLVADARRLAHDPDELGRWIEGVLVEACTTSQQVVLAHADDVGPRVSAVLVSSARAHGSTIWTTSTTPVRWAASAVAYEMPPLDRDARRVAWMHDLTRLGVVVESDVIEQLADLELSRHAIAMTVVAAQSLFRHSPPISALAAISKHFTQGAAHG
ncbi:MAG TPA: hypothetical protein VFQ53_37065 [Kofleriaceae bacterium]|nr:hypothetical protein [Kofleriaceae bacterium]